MADIELVIRIPEEIRLALINNIPLSPDQQSTCDSCIEQAIINGTLLSKGHGRLKDIDKVERLLDLEKPDNVIAKALKNIMESIPTSIEADKAESV